MVYSNLIKNRGTVMAENLLSLYRNNRKNRTYKAHENHFSYFAALIHFMTVLKFTPVY